MNEEKKNNLEQLYVLLSCKYTMLCTQITYKMAFFSYFLLLLFSSLAKDHRHGYGSSIQIGHFHMFPSFFLSNTISFHTLGFFCTFHTHIRLIYTLHYLLNRKRLICYYTHTLTLSLEIDHFYIIYFSFLYLLQCICLRRSRMYNLTVMMYLYDWGVRIQYDLAVNV